ncbi:transmembrane protein 45A-like [Carica papaya]|uniref:transmembrane protein 45A-like n=1 Tax=Carica papaya TaxID=3649 RepID=UPI000B8C714E|nr:transmembrane protein 45A-like [Carica papaya]
MGSLVGHVAPGFAFFLLGFWHLFNHMRLHYLHPNSYTSTPWFPTSKFRYAELFFIMVGTSISIAMELFIGPERHQPFDPDGTIPSYHLHNFEHSSISLTFFVYAVFAILLDKYPNYPAQNINLIKGLTQLIGAIAFAQQLLLFHLHSADHMGVEGQYHLLLQYVIAVSLATTLIGIRYPKSFLISFVRSVSITFQGIWLVVMGYMLWTPGLIPKGCFINLEEGHEVVRCSSQEGLHRAKSLVNIEFSWYLVGITIFAVSFYLGLGRVYGLKMVEYSTVQENDEGGESDGDHHDVESQKRSNKLLEDSKSFKPIDIER